MKLLALDTSTEACSVAAQSGDNRFERHVVRPREHTRLLLPMIREALAELGIASADLDAVIVGNGPGSFIGMRIGAALAQGLCHANGAALVPVSSLEALAAAALGQADGAAVLVAQDAHMNEVYLAGYARGDDGQPELVLPVRLQAAGPIDDLETGFRPAGAGWGRYPALLADNANTLGARIDLDYPHARDLLDLGALRFAAGQTIRPEALTPEYVRERVAARPPQATGKGQETATKR